MANFVERVKWGNVARLAGLVAAAVFFVSSLHGCGESAGGRLQIAHPLPAVKPAPVAPALPAVREKRQLRRPHRKRHQRRRKHALPPAIPQSATPPPPPPPPAPPPA